MQNIVKFGRFIGVAAIFSSFSILGHAQNYPQPMVKTNHFAGNIPHGVNHNGHAINHNPSYNQQYFTNTQVQNRPVFAQNQNIIRAHHAAPIYNGPVHIGPINRGAANPIFVPSAQFPTAQNGQSIAKHNAKIRKQVQKQARKNAKAQAKLARRQAMYGAGQTRRGHVNNQYASFSDRLQGRKNLQSQSFAPAPGPLDRFQQWVDFEPQYKLYPGDQVDIVVQSAPELSRTLTVGPDGRITMPMISPIMAAGKTLPFLQHALETEMAKQLREPTLTVTSRSFTAQQIYVGGQVGQQGTYKMSGPIGSLEAIIMAGGFLPSAKSKQVAIMRRAPNGRWMLRTINHNHGLKNVRSYADNMQLKRGDVIFVPRNTLSEVGVFMNAFRTALPVDLSLTYNIGNGISGN